MRHGPSAGRDPNGLIQHIHDMSRPGDPLVECGHVHEDTVEVHILLVLGADQIVERVAGDCEDWLPVEFGIV